MVRTSRASTLSERRRFTLGQLVYHDHCNALSLSLIFVEPTVSLAKPISPLFTASYVCFKSFLQMFLNICHSKAWVEFIALTGILIGAFAFLPPLCNGHRIVIEPRHNAIERSSRRSNVHQPLEVSLASRTIWSGFFSLAIKHFFPHTAISPSWSPARLCGTGQTEDLRKWKRMAQKVFQMVKKNERLRVDVSTYYMSEEQQLSGYIDNGEHP